MPAPLDTLDIKDLQRMAFVYSTSVPGQVGIVVLNPDGSTISGGGGGSGTVTSVSITTANGVSGTVANPTTTPAITLTLGAITPSSMTVAGQYSSVKFTTTTSLNWNNGNVQYIQLASSGQTFTFANPKDGARYMLILKQPGSGAAGTVTWPGTVLWSGGSAPTLTITNSKTDIITFVYDATNSVYYSGYSLNY